MALRQTDDKFPLILFAEIESHTTLVEVGQKVGTENEAIQSTAPRHIIGLIGKFIRHFKRELFK